MTDNASLELTRFRSAGPPPNFDSASNKQILTRVANCAEPAEYEHAFERWLVEIHRLPGTVLAATFQIEPGDRLTVGIGAANVLETSIEMNRLWGMPIIPGSALKGLARHYANTVHLRQKQIDADQFDDLFGTTDASSYLTWLDAWYVPDSAAKPFEMDVVTVHHRSWYQDPSKPPSDFEDPIPNAALSARGSFLIAVQAPDKDWALAGMTLLQNALEDWGIGAKTGSNGYGRLRFHEWKSQWKIDRGADDQADAQLMAFQNEIGNPAVDANLAANRWCETWAGLDIDQDQKTELGRQILNRLREKPKSYHRITGRVLPGLTQQLQTPKNYVVPLLEWMDEHAPGEFPA